MTSTVRRKTNKIVLTEEEQKESDDGIKKIIGNVALRLGRGVTKLNGDGLVRLNAGISLLNQAQLLVGVDNGKARRIVNQVRRALSIKD